MRAITICQPYAALVMTPAKPVENRTWYTPYRGPLAIHAGKGRKWMSPGDDQRYPNMAFGALVGIVTMIGCYTMEELLQLRPDLATNEHVNGPYCWLFERPQLFETPIPYKGQQGFFTVPDSILPFTRGI